MRKLLPLLLIFFAFGCKSPQYISLNKSPKQFPVMEFEVDQECLENIYPLTVTHAYGGDGYATGVTRKNPAIKHVKTLLTKGLRDNLMSRIGDKQGKIIVRLERHKTEFKLKGCHFLNLMTLYIPSLLGVPIAKLETVAELEMDIYDVDNKLIATYTGEGFDSKLVALYYGYSIKDAQYCVGFNSLHIAMNEIIEKANNDLDGISQKIAKKSETKEVKVVL